MGRNSACFPGRGRGNTEALKATPPAPQVPGAFWTNRPNALDCGYSLDSIADGLSRGLAGNLLDVLLDGSPPGEPFVICGGVALNTVVVNHIAQLTDTDPLMEMRNPWPFKACFRGKLILVWFLFLLLVSTYGLSKKAQVKSGCLSLTAFLNAGASQPKSAAAWAILPLVRSTACLNASFSSSLRISLSFSPLSGISIRG